jgi:hypothetical protein
MEPGGRTRVGLVVLSAASLLASWNPVSAPLGLVVGAAVAALAALDRRRSGALTRLTGLALVLSLTGVLASAAVLGTLVGGARPPGGAPIVDDVPSENREAQLRRAADRTKSARDAARRELDRLEPTR